ncbi:MAG: twin-arginine translocation signal domain-containing protein, partial [Thermoguttaceae bacterium]|nr:twin-arginine translocation signal domain-containing protein [Thermoguttaceae bacterium]
MQRQWTRRDFMATTALGAVAATANLNGFSSVARADESAATYKTQLHSAFILGKADKNASKSWPPSGSKALKFPVGTSKSPT